MPRIHFRIFPISALAFITIGCGPSEPASTRPEVFDVTIAKAALDSMNESYDCRFRNSTSTYSAARYTHDACVLAPNMPRACGIDAIAAFYWSGGNSQTTTLTNTGLEVTGTANEVTGTGTTA